MSSPRQAKMPVWLKVLLLSQRVRLHRQLALLGKAAEPQNHFPNLLLIIPKKNFGEYSLMVIKL